METGRDLNATLDDIRLIGANLADGEQTRQICPDCWGGKSKESTFVVTRNRDLLLYKCHRASCNFSGLLSDGTTHISTNTNENRRNFQPKKYSKLVVELKENQYNWLFNKYNLTRECIIYNQIEYAIHDNGLYIPLYTYKGTIYGYVLKRLTPKVQPKTQMYLQQDYKPRGNFPLTANYDGSPIVVVEDSISALKVSEITPSVALNGVHMNSAMASQLAELTDHLIIALDPDTWNKEGSVGHTLKQRYGALFEGEITVLKLDKDPKDTSYPELFDILGNLVQPQKTLKEILNDEPR